MSTTTTSNTTSTPAAIPPATATSTPGFSYAELIRNCRSFNQRISAERKHRLPFLDAQTGIAQSPSHLWRDRSERLDGPDPYTAFVYPAPKRWRRKKSNFDVYTTDVRWPIKQEPAESTAGGGASGGIGGIGGDSMLGGGDGDLSSHSNMSMSGSNPGGMIGGGMIGSAAKGGAVGSGIGGNVGASVGGPGSDVQLNSSYGRGETSGSMADTKPPQDQTWYDDSDAQMDDYEDPSDGDDYEDTYTKKKNKNKKKSAGGTGEKKSRRPHDIPDSEKPFMCKHCGAKYKTKPGLHYHLTHAHVNEFNEQKERQQAEAGGPNAVISARTVTQSMMVQVQPIPGGSASGGTSGGGGPAASMAVGIQQTTASYQHVGLVKLEPMAQPPQPQMQSPQGQPMENVGRGGTRPLGKFRGEPNRYCDFCLGDASDNKKTNTPEELIHCSDCGRAGHPSCLNFTANMIISTKKYGWQCIECKSCAMCGTSENDDQLLFCDDCDRGFHMYCLRPPLSAPPEGNWSCHLCVIEFGPTASRPADHSGGGSGHHHHHQHLQQIKSE